MRRIQAGSALTIIVISQFLGTSLWFAGNAVIPELSQKLGLPELTGAMTSAVQFGFISGTLIFAILSIPDRFSPSRVFLISSFLAAGFNLLITVFPLSFEFLLTFRYLVGFFLAGIYPVGMKIAADYFEKGLGKALGLLVGALVLGTALPFLIRGLDYQYSYELIFWITSSLAVLGGIAVGLFVPDGPFRTRNPKFDWKVLPRLSQINSLKGAASGYFGHMWELYTFWAFAPLALAYFTNWQTGNPSNSIGVFFIIAIGAFSCALGGFIAAKKSSRTVALSSLLGSGICCILVFLLPENFGFPGFLFLLIWGVLVTADSPQFSTLVAQSTPPIYRGTALTLVNCLGFALTIFSIQLTEWLVPRLGVSTSLGLLGIGPMIGLFLFRFFQKKEALSQGLSK
ncbi:MFS transporter [Algoriphagus limi]|uniref:MFS transporter n=1 Tax=Algoriphagus limi TaxID=2975273 RepID=A0ABT2G579_9BACT|nr:MFS transporter [Algoriphagus limi]MCS5489938.1 MFS transporter [Algoriphagus limi]